MAGIALSVQGRRVQMKLRWPFVRGVERLEHCPSPDTIAP